MLTHELAFVQKKRAEIKYATGEDAKKIGNILFIKVDGVSCILSIISDVIFIIQENPFRSAS
jgi:hypothetical protein